METICKKKKLSDAIHAELKKWRATQSYTLLGPGQSTKGAKKSDKWNLLINEDIEVDDV